MSCGAAPSHVRQADGLSPAVWHMGKCGTSVIEV